MLLHVARTVAFSALLSGLGAQALRHYDIVNNCPTDIALRITGVDEGTIPAGGSTTRDFGSWWSGYIYTPTNGGDTGGARTTRAGFRGQQNYYYIVIDPDWFNVGVTITPINHAPKGGFCTTVECTSITCSTAFKHPLASFPAPVAGVPVDLPLHECPDQLTGYTVIFCPSGKFPPANPARTLHSGADSSKCLDVRGAVYANGTPVQIYDCNGTGAQKWVLQRGSTKVRLSGTNFCLDAGSKPGNGVGMKIWQCYDNLPAQQWYYTEDNRVALQDKGLCLDLTNGVTTNSNKAQTWQCANGNNNQVWTW